MYVFNIHLTTQVNKMYFSNADSFILNGFTEYLVTWDLNNYIQL